jgi:hypothetical protein
MTQDSCETQSDALNRSVKSNPYKDSLNESSFESKRAVELRIPVEYV